MRRGQRPSGERSAFLVPLPRGRSWLVIMVFWLLGRPNRHDHQWLGPVWGLNGVREHCFMN